MAGKTISQEQLAEAVKLYCITNLKQSSQSEEKPFKITIFEGSPQPGDPMLWLEDGLFRCSETEFGLMFAEEYLRAPEKPAIPIPKRNIPAAEKPAGGAKNGLAVRDVQVQDLTFEDIKTYICPDANDQEAFMFLKLCQARNLNPFTREAYLVKYGGKANMIVGKEAFTRKAEANPQFDGFEAGIIVQAPENGPESSREGSFVRPNEVLIGGWAKVYRKDRKMPFFSEVSMKEYTKGQATWKDMPATMIRKVALVTALREAFPSDLGGMYDQAEMGIDPAREVSA